MPLVWPAKYQPLRQAVRYYIPRKRMWHVYEGEGEFGDEVETFDEACQNCGNYPVNEFGLCADCDELFDEED